MIRRTLAALSSAGLLLLLASITAIAGGWADIKVDGGAHDETGRRQDARARVHGPSAWRDAGRLRPSHGLDHERGDRRAPRTSFRRRAAPSGTSSATVTFPSAGYWTWSVSTPELIVDSVPVTMEVLTAAGRSLPSTQPSADDGDRAGEARPARHEMDTSLRPAVHRSRVVDQRPSQPDRGPRKPVQALTTSRDELAARLASAETGSGGVPVLGIVLLAVLAGATAGFAMAWLGGRPNSATIRPARSPGADPA